MVAKLRELDYSDLQGLYDFLLCVDREFPTPLSSFYQDLEEYARRLLSNGMVIASFDSEGTMSGFAGGYVNDASNHEAYLSALVVKPESRTHGVGARLINEFEVAARSSSMRTCRLTVNRLNEAALSLYRKRGYVVTGSDDKDYEMKKVIVGLSEERPNILLSSAGRRTYIVEWFMEALGGTGKVHASNSDASAPTLLAADKSVITPLIYSDEYIPFLLDYCERERIGAIIPLFDVDIPVLAANRHLFESIGCFPVVAAEGFAKACADKMETSSMLRASGIPCLNTYVGSKEFLQACDRGDARFPAFIKPRWGMGSIGLAEAIDAEELRALCGIVERKVRESYLRYESSADDPARGIVVQSKVDGDEYGMDVYCDLSGEYRGYAVRRKVAMRAGETDVAEVMCPDSRFEALARSLAEISLHPGNMDVDIFDIDGHLFVLEMNARFGGGYPFSHAAGVNLPCALISWLRGDDCDQSLLEVAEPGTYLKDMVIVPAKGGC